MKSIYVSPPKIFHNNYPNCRFIQKLDGILNGIPFALRHIFAKKCHFSSVGIICVFPSQSSMNFPMELVGAFGRQQPPRSPEMVGLERESLQNALNPGVGIILLCTDESKKCQNESQTGSGRWLPSTYMFIMLFLLLFEVQLAKCWALEHTPP